VTVFVLEADDASDEIQKNRSCNATRLGTSYGQEVGDWHGNKIRPWARPECRIRPAAAGGALDQAWIFLRNVVAAVGSHPRLELPAPLISFYIDRDGSMLPPRGVA
jgi:hypothetical protein